MKNKRFILFLLIVSAILSGCGGGGGGGGTTAVSCASYTPMSASGKYKISVKEAGIYLISPGTLKTSCLDSSPLPVSNPFQGFKLQSFDPTHSVNNTANGFFDIPISYDPAGNIEFYGVGVNRNDYTAPNADYTETNVYWLVPSLTPASQMSTKSSVSNGSPLSPITTFHLEQNKIWWDSMFGGTALGYDHWFWDNVPSTKTSQPYNFMINNYDSGYSDQLKFSAYLQGAQATHTISNVLLNGAPAPTNTTVSWSTSDPMIYSTTMPPGVTNGVINAFQFSAGGTLDNIYFNWLELEYPAKALSDQLIFHGNFSTTQAYSFSVNGFSQSTIELFDISDPKNPWKFDNTISVIPSGAGYQLGFGDSLTTPNKYNYIALTPAQRKTPAGIVSVVSQDLTKSLPATFDYVMIVHESLYGQGSKIPDLSLYRQGQGFNVQVVPVGDVYDNFSGGLFTPQAIQDFLVYIQANKSATYALLVGDASVDYKNYLGYGQENLVPTYLTDYSHGQIPSDFWFVPRAGNQLNMAIGRLPAKNLTELNTMVNKIISYETTNKPSSASWNQTLSFVGADSTYVPFDSDSEGLISTIMGTSGISPNLAYYGYFYGTTSTGSLTTIYTTNSATLNNDIVTALNNGSLITNYFGHGSVSLWANGVLGQLSGTFFQSSDLLNLTNSSKLTFLVTLDCLNGFFAGYGEGTSQTTPYSLAESAVKSPGGAVASFSPTGQGYTTSHFALAQILYPIILSRKPPPPCAPGAVRGTGGCPVLTNTIGLEIKDAESNYLALPGTSNAMETVSIFVLLGDPATQLWVP